MKNVFYYIIGFLVLSFTNTAFAAAIPFAESLADEAEDQTIFEFFSDLFTNAATVVFTIIGAIIFIVWIVFCISKFVDWKNDRIQKMDLFGDIGTASIFAVALFAILAFANTYIAG